MFEYKTKHYRTLKTERDRNMENEMHKIIAVRGEGKDSSHWVDIRIQENGRVVEISNSMMVDEFEELFGFTPDEGTQEGIVITRLGPVSIKLEQEEEIAV